MPEQSRNESADMVEDPTFAAAVRQGHEPSKLAVRTIAITGISLFLVAACGMGIVALVLKSKTQLPADTSTASEEWKHGATDPGVQPNQAAERQRFAQRNQERLRSYGWANDEHSAARIPIERAMEIMAEHKLQVNWSSTNKQEATP